MHIYHLWRKLMFKLRTRVVTQDKGLTPIHTTEQIGDKRSKTPEGFLLCEDVPVARTGLMLYGPGEVPITTGHDGVVRITRGPDELFHSTTISSFNGKPVVNEHPTYDVNPTNWRELAVGICMNPRQGIEEFRDCIVADMLITDAVAIRDIQAGKREVSAGYAADYEETAHGEGRQANIIGNHVALVERGRCGPRCAIGDQQPSHLKEHYKMGTRTIAPRQRRELPEAVRKLFRDMEQVMEDNPALMDEGNAGDLSGNVPIAGNEGSNDTHIHVHMPGEAAAQDDGVVAPPDMPADDGGGGGDIESRVAAIENTLSQILEMLQGGGDAPPDDEDPPPDDVDAEGPPAEEDPPPTRDNARRSTGDSAALAATFASVIADAEILCPGYRFPTFDSNAVRKTTVDTMCALRKRVLENLYTTIDGKALVDNVVGGGSFNIHTSDCATAAVYFKATAGAKRAINNSASTRDARIPGRVGPMAGAAGKVTSISDLNALHQKHYGNVGQLAK